MTEMLDLDAEVTAGQLADLTATVAGLAGDHQVRDVVDLGAGTGTGTFALLRRFPEATVTAIDTSADMLSHLGGSAQRHGVEGRIRPLLADVDAGWPETGPADLVWASSSMHHMKDPDRVLADIRATLRPGGLLTMIEMDSVPRFLPYDIGLGRPGLEDRCHEIAGRARAEHMPHQGSDWASRLIAAGFTVREAREQVIDLSAPLPELAVRYAVTTLRRFRAGVVAQLADDDREALDTLLADDAKLLRDLPGLRVHSARSVWIAAPTR
ncbi:class I SAM-dependent methyltransferase [Actinoplanes couchii]|nr:class I SAM-dependent methyltransferase [Actinoplanes couchii]MDR6316408.1 SAM-dependent methyltransferase [Actinoplanes couchii]